jgi:ATP-dependent Zn protease
LIKINTFNEWQRIWFTIMAIYFCVASPMLIINQPWEEMTDNIRSITILSVKENIKESVEIKQEAIIIPKENTNNKNVLILPKLQPVDEETMLKIRNFKVEDIVSFENEPNLYTVKNLIVDIFIFFLITIIYWILPMIAIYFGGYNLTIWLINGFKNSRSI